MGRRELRGGRVKEGMGWSSRRVHDLCGGVFSFLFLFSKYVYKLKEVEKSKTIEVC